MLVNRAHHSLVVVKGQLYAVGDWYGEKRVERLNQVTRKWEFTEKALRDTSKGAAIVVI